MTGDYDFSDTDTDAREHRRLFWLGFLIGTFNAVFLGAVTMGLILSTDI